MPTSNQLKNRCRLKKQYRSKTPGLDGNPQKKGKCLKLFTRTPKKPNSALRKVVKFELSSGKVFEAYVPGQGKPLEQHALALVQGGRVQDLPGVKYHLIRGTYDFEGLHFRRNARSRYGAKRDTKAKASRNQKKG